MLDLPANLVRAAAEPATGALRAWVAALPGIVAEVTRTWHLEVGPPFQPGGVASWVAPARTADGAAAVLKVGWRHDEACHEADGLRVWDGDGAVRLLDELVLGDTAAMLLEACEPGTPLARRLPPDEQDVVVAELLRRLWIEPPPALPFRPLASMCDAWSASFERRYAASRTPGLDPGLARAGVELFRALPRDATRDLLLCTDLHAGNVLAAQREPWLVIDPKPYVGDPAYDALQHLLNCPERLRTDAAGLAARLARLLELDEERLGRWLFARVVLESLSRPDLHPVARALAP
ncbi:MAG: aminoglycoside phosphotransferase family protein [Actinomycetota bacterium]|nr:aminoglycoside phosphotransferase family protein [Actinomycetota bacterium]